MPIRIFDSFQKRKVELVPRVPGRIGMYLCGPTTYDSAHLGHARTAVSFDVVRRALMWRGFQVFFVRNVTDIDDKIIRRAAERGVSPFELARHYSDEYDRDMALLGVLPPDAQPRVTEHIPDIIAFIEKLVAAGKAYPAGGDVYYSVGSFPDYGKLSGQSIADLEAGARVEPGEHKRNPLDFALWKAAKPGEPSWDSPWGPGRPGWHIECSAMASKYLGDTFDIHAGGKDLIFPHHENEIAQSQGLSGPGTFARYWMHTGFLNFNDEKMSKSLGNVFLIGEVARLYDPEALRFFLVQQHYRSPINFEVLEEHGRPVFPGLEEAERRLDYFYSTLQRADDFLGERREEAAGPVAAEAERLRPEAEAAIDDDFNTAVVVAELGEAAKALNKLLDDPKAAPKDVRRRSVARLLRDLRDVAGGVLGLLGREPRAFLHSRRARRAAALGLDPEAIEARLRERDTARRAKDFTRADAIRAELRERGIEIMDTARGSDWRISD